MDVQLKQRVVGAAVLAALAVIFIPVLLDDGRRHEPAPLPPPPTVVPDPARAPPPPAPAPDAVDDIQHGMTATPTELAHMPLETRVPPEPEPEAAEPPPRPKVAAPAAKSEVPESGAKKSATVPEKWIIQLGIYANEANATSLQAKLKQAGIATTLLRPQEPGKPFRLQTPPVASKDKAETLRKRLEKDLDVKGIVKRQP
ncbi:MAG: SPOR domain-containing protein [Gammaproteobacteria bacterium]|nr:SPOR domain-containing protein [Gammaproteobacteria bacterium]